MWHLIIDYYGEEHYFFFNKENAIKFAKEFFDNHSDYFCYYCGVRIDSLANEDNDYLRLIPLEFEDVEKER